MARATFRQIVADIQRLPNLASLSFGHILDAVATAEKDIGNQPWPWNYKETNVLVPPPYSTGAVDVVNNTPTVTGAAGNLPNWTPYIGQIGWRLRFGNSNLDYIISSIVNATTITLEQPVNLSASLVNSSYTLYKDTYGYPSDYMIGSDVALLQPIVRSRIPKIPRYRFEMAMNAGLRSFSTNIQMFYCDQGQTSTGVYQFRLGPPPAGPCELRLCYHSTAPDLTNITDTTLLPEGYDEIIGLMAASKLYDTHRQPGMSDGCKNIAAGKLRLLKKQIAAQTIDDTPNASNEVPDSSISQWGMMIGRMP
jgi:hypothetical protein